MVTSVSVLWTTLTLPSLLVPKPGVLPPPPLTVSTANAPVATMPSAEDKPKVEQNVAAAVDAKSKSIGIGYNLGPVAIVGQMAKMENITHVTGTGDVDVAFVKVTTNF